MTLDCCSDAAPLAILLLAGGFRDDELSFENNGLIVVSEGRLIFTTTNATNRDASSSEKNQNTLISQLIQRLREELRGGILDRKIREPSWNIDSNDVVKVIKLLIGTDGS